jgi:hypothetical protein
VAEGSAPSATPAPWFTYPACRRLRDV